MGSVVQWPYTSIFSELTTPVSFTTPNNWNPSSGEEEEDDDDDGDVVLAESWNNCCACSRHKPHPGRRTAKRMVPNSPIFFMMAS